MDVSFVCFFKRIIGRGGAWGRGTESSFEKLQKVISADVKADVKQQEIKRTGSYIL